MTSALLAYLFYFVASTASPLQLRWLKNKKENGGEIAFAFWVLLILNILALCFPLISPFHFTGNPWALTGLTILCGALGAGYFITSFIAQKHVEAGVTSLALNINTPVAIFFATLLLGENLKPLQMVGTVLLLAALFLISKKHRISKFKFDKHFAMMLGAGVMLGLLLVAERALQKMTGWSAGTMLSWWAQCAGLGLMMLVYKSKNTYGLKDTLITGVLRFLQGFSWVLLVFLVGNISVISAITTFKVVIIFIAAAIFLKEREDLPRKILGSIIAVAGLLLMR
jgi:drug/metabolite transporter (DMT)-like permease